MQRGRIAATDVLRVTLQETPNRLLLYVVEFSASDSKPFAEPADCPQLLSGRYLGVALPLQQPDVGIQVRGQRSDSKTLNEVWIKKGFAHPKEDELK
jgi:hypothetical protein